MAVFGFALGGVLVERWGLEFLILASGPLGKGPSDSLPALFGSSPGLVIAIGVFLLATLLAIYPKPIKDFGYWHWYVTGALLGTAGTLAWLLGRSSGWHWGLSMVGPTRTLYHAFTDLNSNEMTWGAFMILGIPVGSLISAWSRGTLRWQVPVTMELPRRFVGGLVMGAGGTLAAGCNIGNALTGLSVLSVNSVVATGSMIAGLALAAHVQEKGSD